MALVDSRLFYGPIDNSPSTASFMMDGSPGFRSITGCPENCSCSRCSTEQLCEHTEIAVLDALEYIVLPSTLRGAGNSSKSSTSPRDKQRGNKVESATDDKPRVISNHQTDTDSLRNSKDFSSNWRLSKEDSGRLRPSHDDGRRRRGGNNPRRFTTDASHHLGKFREHYSSGGSLDMRPRPQTKLSLASIPDDLSDNLRLKSSVAKDRSSIAVCSNLNEMSPYRELHQRRSGEITKDVRKHYGFGYPESDPDVDYVNEDEPSPRYQQERRKKKSELRFAREYGNPIGRTCSMGVVSENKMISRIKQDKLRQQERIGEISMKP